MLAEVIEGWETESAAEQVQAIMGTVTPTGRMGRPEEIAKGGCLPPPRRPRTYLTGVPIPSTAPRPRADGQRLEGAQLSGVRDSVTRGIVGDLEGAHQHPGEACDVGPPHPWCPSKPGIPGAAPRRE